MSRASERQSQITTSKQTCLLSAVEGQFLTGGHFVGPASRLGKAITGGALQDKSDGMVYIDQVPGGNIQGGDMLAGGDHGTNHMIASTLIKERPPVSAIRSWLGRP